jgi:hypothetical protein
VRSNLAISYLIQGETQNCIARHDARSCILPITVEAQHVQPAPARMAGDLYGDLLAEYPRDFAAKWLFNVARMVTGDYPAGVGEAHRLPAALLERSTTFPSWKDIAPQLGLNAFDLSGGAVVDDFDGDGLLDVITSTLHPCEPMKAFRNDGEGGFEEVTAAWGLDGQLGGLNLIHGDYDGDGRLDLLVLRGAWWGEGGRIRNSLLRNDLDRPAGRFVDATAVAGIGYPAYPTQAAAWSDYDLDGDLDLFVGNESPLGATDPLSLFGRIKRPYPSQLFRNNGDGTFTDVARAAGVVNLRFAKGVAWGDYDDDGPPDLYVSNFAPNRLYRNDRQRGFTDVAEELGVTEPEGSFPTWFFDHDNDGDLDLFVADYSTPFDEVAASYFGIARQGGHPLVYRNDGDRFTEVSVELGLTRPLLPMGANYGDLDNDGWLDVYLGTGVPNFGAIQPNAMYRNVNGTSFEDVTFDGGFGHLQKGHAVAFGDLDNDGDQDLYEQMGGAYPYDSYGNVLYENPGNANRWIVLRLAGSGSNRFGVGARVEIRVATESGSRSIHRVVGWGGSFGGSSYQQEIGLGEAKSIESVHVWWPGREQPQTYSGAALDRFFLATEGSADLVPLDLPRIRLNGQATARPAHPHRSSEP